MTFKRTLCTALLALSMILSACSPAAQAETTPTMNPEAVLTAAALTAQVRMTALAANTPSPLPPTPTAASLSTTLTATASATAGTGGVPTTPAPPPTGGSDRLEFVADLTVPDGTVFKPGEQFTKTWRLMNAGTSTWTTAYALAFSSGEQMGGPATVLLTQQVPPGQAVDLSVQLTAPNAEGNHTGYWMLRNASGTNFGMGSNADGAFYVQINVSGSAASATPGTGTPSVSPTPSGETVTGASLSVDAATVEEECPYTFTFTASFTLSEAATVTYRLEADTSYTIDLPGPTTANLNAGASQVTYTLDFTDSVSGSARLHVTSPEDIQSEPVSFSLKCQ